MELAFAWKDRTACVEALARVCADRKTKFETALTAVLMPLYCDNHERMTRKQLAALKRDVSKRAKDIVTESKAPELGDIVLVPKLIPNEKLGGISGMDGSRSKLRLSILGVCHPAFTIRCVGSQITSCRTVTGI